MALTLSTNKEHAWEQQVTEERDLGNLSAGQLIVGTVLCRLLAGDEAMPTHQLLAALAHCSVSTVQEALRRLRAIGLLTWQQQWRHDWHTTGRRRQLANRYELRLREAPAVARPELKRRRRGGGNHRPVDSSIYRIDAWVARAELARIAARRQQDLLLDKKTAGGSGLEGRRPGGEAPQVRGR